MAMSDDVGMIKIPLTEQGDTIIVQRSGAAPLGVILTLHDSRGKGTSNVDASPAECDALIAAIGRARGRTPSDLARRALSVALRIDPYDNTESCTIAIEDAAEIAAILREVAAREQGATVPRAGVEALRARLAKWCEDEGGRNGGYREGMTVGIMDAIVGIDALLAAPTTQTEKG